MSLWHSGKFAVVLRAGCHGILFWLCVFFLYFVRILWYFSPCRKNTRKPLRLLKAHFCCFNDFCFPFFSTTVQCNWLWPVFPVRVIMDLNVDVKHIISLSFSLYLFCNIFFPFLPNCILLYMKSPSSPHSILSNTDNLWVFLSHSWHWKACQNGFAQHLEHLLFYGADTSSQNASGNTALHISALYNKASMETDSLIWSYYYHNYHCCFAKGVNPSLSLSEQSGKLYPRSSVQGSK